MAPEVLITLVTFLVTTVGAILSATITLAVAVAELPASSTPVSVTMLLPRLEQSNAILSIERVNEQLSYEPLSTSSTVRFTLPSASRYTVTSFAITVGAVLSLVSTEKLKVVSLLPSEAIQLIVVIPAFNVIPDKSVPEPEVAPDNW